MKVKSEVFRTLCHLIAVKKTMQYLIIISILFNFQFPNEIVFNTIKKLTLFVNIV